MSSTLTGAPAQDAPRKSSRYHRSQAARKHHHQTHRGVSSFGGLNSGPRASRRSLPRGAREDETFLGGGESFNASDGSSLCTDDPHAFNTSSFGHHSSNQRSNINNDVNYNDSNNVYQQLGSHNNTNNSGAYPQHSGNGSRPRVWWPQITRPEEIPAVFLPRACSLCGVLPSTPSGMVEHICSVSHCRKLLAQATSSPRPLTDERTGQPVMKLTCELCRVSLGGLLTARNHFAGNKHRTFLKTIRADLRNCRDVTQDGDERSDGHRTPLGQDSANSISRVDNARRKSTGDEVFGDDERRRRDSRVHNGQQQGLHCNDDSSTKDRRKQAPCYTSSREQRRSLNGERQAHQRSAEDDKGKDSGKHQYFFSSEEECSDKETPLPNGGGGVDALSADGQDSDRSKTQSDPKTSATSDQGDDLRTTTDETKPKVPLVPLVGSSGRSLVDKRKDIISKLSSCTDVRDLTKQLRQMSRVADEKQKTARKMLPGVAFTNRDIEKQETFGEARARAALEEFTSGEAPELRSKGFPVKDELNRDPRKSAVEGSNEGSAQAETPSATAAGVATGTEGTSRRQVPSRLKDDEESDECTILAAPPQPPPQTISDSEDGEEEAPPAVIPTTSPHTPSVQITPQFVGTRSTVNGLLGPSGTLPADDFARAAALAAEEAACQERLRYLTHALPRVEALLTFLRHEEQAVIAQYEHLRTAKTRLVAALSHGPQPPPGAELFAPSQILSAILAPPALSAARNQPDNLAWLLNSSTAHGSNLQNLLDRLRIVANGVTQGSAPVGHTLPLNTSILPEQRPQAAVGDTVTAAQRGSCTIGAGLTASGVLANILTLNSTPTSAETDRRKRSNTTPDVISTTKRPKSADVRLDEQLHSEQVLAVRLSGDFVYTSSRDGVVKRTPLNDGHGAVVIYRHCGQDSNSSLKKVCAYMLEVWVHKKLPNTKLITGSDDCAVRVFDGDSGHLMKVIPVRARVLCGFIAWQKLYIGLKSGYIQVYHVFDQRFVAESEVRQVPKFITTIQTTASKKVVVVTQDNSMMLRDAGTLFLLYAIDKRDQNITALVVKDENILLAGESKVYIFDKGGRLSREVELDTVILNVTSFNGCLLIATNDGLLRGFGWGALMNGELHERGQLEWTSAALAPSHHVGEPKQEGRQQTTTPEVVTALHCDGPLMRVAIVTEAGRVVVFVDIDTTFGSAAETLELTTSSAETEDITA